MPIFQIHCDNDSHDREYLKIIIRQQGEILEHLELLHRKEKQMSDALVSVQTAVTALEADAAAIVTAVLDGAAQVSALTQQVADLQAQVAAGSVATVEDLQAITDRLAAIAAEFAAVLPPSAPAPETEPAPTE